ncbi:MAG TPA: EAL domain-containing protein, partial [Deltaproteobacteria bacterium]|nr:EAL domain-containing protein [Deltaproteobacteria bacterium]
NRRHFESLLLRKVTDAATDKTQLSLIFIDCDKFKQVNDTLGHHAGDQVLKRLADCIRSGIRLNSDIPFRLGGDEFVILLPGTGEELAVDVADRIRMLFLDNSVGETTLSMGVASSYFDEESLQAQMKAFVSAADQQAYRVKAKGGDGTCSIELIGITVSEKHTAHNRKKHPVPISLNEIPDTESKKEYCKDCLGIPIDQALAGNQIVGFVQALVTHSTDGVLFIDRNGLVMGINSAGLGMMGYASKDVIGHSWSMFNSRIDHLDCLQNIRLKLLKPGYWRETVWYDRQDGSYGPFELYVTVVQGRSGSIGGFCVQFRDLTEIKIRDEKLYDLAHFDSLTGLPNRNLFLQKLQQAVVSTESPNGKIVVFRLYIENFRHIREIFYAESADLLMGLVTERVNSIFHTSAIVSRYSVDELAVLIEDIQDLKVVELLSRRIVGGFQSDFHVNGHEFFLTISVGSAIYPNDANNAEKLMCNAGLAMFRAKQEGKNSSYQYKQKLSDQVHNRYDLCKRLRRALHQDEFSVWYQPQIDIKNDTVSGVEALIRWEAEPGKFIPPMEFISVAEETGIILELGLFVLREACRQTVLWLEEGIELQMAVNISARQLQQTDFAILVTKILEESGMAPEQLELEITETMIMENRDLAAILLWELKDIGISVVVDDFGSGYSSLAYLKQFPFGTLKIDRAFVMNLPDSGDDVAITSTIINMAASLDLEVVAEGVETTAQLQFFKERGCDKVQGYLFSAPRLAPEMTKLLRRWNTEGVLQAFSDDIVHNR